MEFKKKNIKNIKVLDDEGSFCDLRKTLKGEKLRDTILISDFKDTGNKYQIGVSIVYPKCKTGGHAHTDAEEIYNILEGNGLMVIDGSEYKIESGDVFIVTKGQKHTTINSGNLPLKYFWVVCKNTGLSK